MSKHILNAKGLLCPMPVIKVQNIMPSLQVGDQLEVLCTDPGTKYDIPAWCRVHGHTLDKIVEADGMLILHITKAAE